MPVLARDGGHLHVVDAALGAGPPHQRADGATGGGGVVGEGEGGLQRPGCQGDEGGAGSALGISLAA